MGSCDAALALAEGQRAARSAIPEWDRVTPQKLWPKANAQLDQKRPQRDFVVPKPGEDVVEIEVESLGRLRNYVTSAKST